MITSPQNPHLKALRLLTKGRGRDKASQRAASLLGLAQGDRHPADQLILLEGPLLIEAALEADLPLVCVYASTEVQESEHHLVARLRTSLDSSSSPSSQVALHFVEPLLLRSLADADSPRGLIAVARAPAQVDLLQGQTRPDADQLVLYLDRLSDPGNLGAILRVAEATGVSLVACSPGCANWRHPRAVRASAGSALRVPLVSECTADDLRSFLGSSARWLGLDAAGSDLFAQAFRAEELATTLVIAAGSESLGLAPDTKRHCDDLLAIPMSGSIESLNVATACAVALYHFRNHAHSRQTRLHRADLDDQAS